MKRRTPLSATDSGRGTVKFMEASARIGALRLIQAGKQRLAPVSPDCADPRNPQTATVPSPTTAPGSQLAHPVGVVAKACYLW
jgi:hypothetical protein